MSLSPPWWTLDQFTEGAARGIEVFRVERLNEAREDYISHFDEARSAIEDLLELSTDLTTLQQTGHAAVADYGYLEALRYIAAPPVSTEPGVRPARRTDNLVVTPHWPDDHLD
jgi:hypothetical protein